MSCEYQSQYERILGWMNGDTPIVAKSCLCFGRKNVPDCPYFLADDQNEQKNCPRYKEKIDE